MAPAAAKPTQRVFGSSVGMDAYAASGGTLLMGGTNVLKSGVSSEVNMTSLGWSQSPDLTELRLAGTLRCNPGASWAASGKNTRLLFRAPFRAPATGEEYLLAAGLTYTDSSGWDFNANQFLVEPDGTVYLLLYTAWSAEDAKDIYGLFCGTVRFRAT